MIAAVFGWTVPQVLALTWPQFEYISCQLCRLQYMRAKNEVFFGVAAALGGAEARDNLFASAGSFFKLDDVQQIQFTPEQLAAARERMKKIQEAAQNV